MLKCALWCLHAWRVSFACTHTLALISVTFIDVLKGAIRNRIPVSCVLSAADAAGHHDMVLSDRHHFGQ